MRATLNIFLAFLIILSTSGVFISIHYCHNHLVSVSFFKTKDNCCGKTCSSCKNENISFKVKTKVVPSVNSEIVHNTELSNSFILSSQLFLYKDINSYIQDIRVKPPPGEGYFPLYISKLRL